MNPERRTWILLRGLAREKGHWGPFVERMSQEFRNDEVLCIDLPGAGEFRDQVSPSSMEEIFSFVRAKAIEKSRSQSQLRLVALSLGGMVALEWMRQRPDDLAGCVLINTSCRTLNRPYERLRWQTWGRLIKLLTQPSPRERERLLVQIVMNSEEARSKALPLWTKIAMDHPMRYRSIFNQVRAAAKFKQLPENTSVPTLLLSGLGDRLVDPVCSIALHDKFGWPLESHPWAGHDLTWDDGEWVLSKLKAWDSSLAQ